MKKFILAIFLTTFCIADLFSMELDKKLFTDCLNPTVKVNSGDYSGTGVLVRCDKVDSQYCSVIATCAHVLASPRCTIGIPQYSKKGWFEGYEMVQGVVYGQNNTLDIAILCVVTPQELPVAKFDFQIDKIQLLDSVFKIACHKDTRLNIGKISGLSLDKNMKYYQTDAPTVFGDSGGPLFKGSSLIGIVQSVKACEENCPFFNCTYVIPVDYYKDWSKAENANLDFLYNKEQKLPKLPFMKLKFKKLKGVLPNAKPK